MENISDFFLILEKDKAYKNSVYFIKYFLNLVFFSEEIVSKYGNDKIEVFFSTYLGEFYYGQKLHALEKCMFQKTNSLMESK